MCGLLYEQVYMTDEVVYDVGDTNCDTLYFVWAGKLKVQAKVTITQDTVMPIGNKVWEKNTRSTDVHYFVKQLDAGSYFGLEELVDIAAHKLDKNEEKAKKIVR